MPLATRCSTATSGCCAPHRSGRPAAGASGSPQGSGSLRMMLSDISRSVDECRFIDLPKIADQRGNLTFVESGNHIPFQTRRIYYLYDVPGGSVRGSHAHKGLEQLIIAMSGSFDVILDDGRKTKRFTLNRSYYGLYVCPMMWRTLDNFSSGAVCLVMASQRYDEDDYIRDYGTFKQLAG